MRRIVDPLAAKRSRLAALAIAAALSGPAASFAAELDNPWQTWRGPNGSGAIESADPPTEWSDTKNVLWKVAVPGKGSASPIVYNDRVYVMTAIKTDRVDPSKAAAAAEAAKGQEAGGEAGREGGRGPGGPEGRGPGGPGGLGGPGGPGGPGGGRGGRGGGGGFGGGGNAPVNYYQFAVLCYSLQSGEQLWQKVLAEEVPHEAGHNTNSFASASPVTDGRYLVANFGSRGLYTLDMDGSLLWKADLGEMQTRAGFGEGASPAIHGETLVVPWDHEGGSLVAAFDIRNGSEIWRQSRDERTTWSTPLTVLHEGRVQAVLNGTTVRSYDLADGKLIWQCGGQVQNPIPTPILYGQNVICMTGFRGAAIASISLDAQGDVTGGEAVQWTRDDVASYVPSAALLRNRLYFLKSNNGILSSVDADTGEVLMQPTRVPEVETVYSSPVAAADRVYVTGRDGVTVVVRDSNELEVLATNRIGEPVDSSIAIAGDRLLIRGESHLFCIGKK